MDDIAPPDDRLVNRAVEIWKEYLRDIQYPSNGYAQAMAGAIYQDMDHNVTEETLEDFGEALRDEILTPDEHGRYGTYMDVDYHPTEQLQDAAEKAGLGLDPGQWPWKTGVRIGEDYVRVFQNEGWACHYPLSGGRWLVTALEGDDIDKLIDLINRSELGPDLFQIDYESEEVSHA